MGKGRLEAFSDGVIAVLITIMVLELRAPDQPTWTALAARGHSVFIYVVSFLILGIYWNNHHHLLHMTDRVNGAILWANLNLLFWLSLVPYATSWIAGYPSASVPAAVYAIIMLAAGVSYRLLAQAIIWAQGPGSKLGAAVGRDIKGKLSLALYTLAVALAFVRAWTADAVFLIVALMWLIPDRRFESRFSTPAGSPD